MTLAGLKKWVPITLSGRLVAAALFVLVGFGLLAGAIPLHGWAPQAHAGASAPAAALFSTVVMKVGLYGMLTVSLAGGVPTLIVSQQPTELIVFKGTPDFVPVTGTQLLWAANTTADVFVETGNNQYYVLMSGRWFSAPALTELYLDRYFRDPNALLVSEIGIGIAWASILAMPYAILASSLPQKKLGIYMGLFNVFIVVPQLLVATVMGSILKKFFPTEPIWTMAFAAIVMALAALAMLRVKEAAD